MVASIRLTLSLAFVLLTVSAASATAAPGDLDPSFGTYGKYLSPIEGSTTGEEVVVQPDGAILVGGGSPAGSTIFRFTAAGLPDPSFGQNGRAVLPSVFGDTSVALQGDKIVAAATAGGRVVVFRLRSDGALDQSFAAGGTADTGLPSAGYAPQLAIDSEQRIVVSVMSAPIPGVAVARLLPDGESFDPTFAGGVVYHDADSGGLVEAIALGPANEITVLASTFAGPIRSRLFRFRGDGSLDPGFGTGGAAEVLPGVSAYFDDVVVRPDGSLIAVGQVVGGSRTPGVIAALTPAGQPDPGFAGDGAVEIESAGSELGAVGLDSQGRILVTGSAITALRKTGLLLGRYLPDGSPDATFGVDGTASAIFGRATTTGRALATTTDGRIVVAAERITGFRSTHYVLGLMRFLISDGPRDPDADGVLGKRDRCPQLGGTARNRGCPLIEREVELEVHQHGVKGTVVTRSSACDGVGRAAIFGVQPGRDDLVGRVKINKNGRFRARLGPRFRGRVYASLGTNLTQVAGLCGPASSNKVSVG